MRKFFNLTKCPPSVLLVAVCVLLEACLVLGLALFFLFAILSQNMYSVLGAVFLWLLLAICAMVMFYALYSFVCLRKYWTKNLLFTWQIFQISIAIPTTFSEYTFFGVFLLLLAVTIMIFLFTPKIVTWVGGEKKF